MSPTLKTNECTEILEPPNNKTPRFLYVVKHIQIAKRNPNNEIQLPTFESWHSLRNS